MIKFVKMPSDNSIISYSFEGDVISGIVDINKNTNEINVRKFISNIKNTKQEKDLLVLIIVPKIIEKNFPEKYTWATH